MSRILLGLCVCGGLAAQVPVRLDVHPGKISLTNARDRHRS